MRKSFLLMVFLAAMAIAHAQESTQILNEGDVVTLGKPNGTDYQHLDFPRMNIIIKRGAIPNFKVLIGKKLVVDRLETNKYGNTETILRRKDGLNFFRFYPVVKTDLTKALETGEIKRL